MEWKLAESRIKPQETEKCFKDGYYIRKNIKEEERESQDGKKIIMYVYDEAIANNLEFVTYMSAKLTSEMIATKN